MHDYALMAKMAAHGKRTTAPAKAPRENPGDCSCAGNGMKSYAPGVTNGGCGGDVCGCPTGPGIECRGSIVQGNALAKPLDSGVLTWTLRDCREPVFITCPSHGFFKIDPDTGLVFFYDFTTCTFDADPSPGGCPTSYAQPFAVQDEDGKYRAFVCLPDGTYRIEAGGNNQPPTFTRVDCAPANCKMYALKWDGVTFVITGPLDLNDLDVAISISNCPIT